MSKKRKMPRVFAHDAMLANSPQTEQYEYAEFLCDMFFIALKMRGIDEARLTDAMMFGQKLPFDADVETKKDDEFLKPLILAARDAKRVMDEIADTGYRVSYDASFRLVLAPYGARDFPLALTPDGEERAHLLACDRYEKWNKANGDALPHWSDVKRRVLSERNDSMLALQMSRGADMIPNRPPTMQEVEEVLFGGAGGSGGKPKKKCIVRRVFDRIKGWFGKLKKVC